MAFLTALASDVGGGVWRRLFPWCLLLVVVIGLVAALIVRSAQLKAAQVELAVTRHEGDMAKADTQRWLVATTHMQKIIDGQAAQLKRQAADLMRAQQIADENARAEETRLGILNSQLANLKARADARPADIRPLGPLVTDVLNGMRRDTAGQSGASPAAD